MNDSDFQGIFLLNKRLFFSTKGGAATKQKVVRSPPHTALCRQCQRWEALFSNFSMCRIEDLSWRGEEGSDIPFQPPILFFSKSNS